MLNKDRPFESFYESLEAYCAEVLCLGEDKDFWERYKYDGTDIENYLACDYEDGIAKYHDWLWSESTEDAELLKDVEESRKDPFHNPKTDPPRATFRLGEFLKIGDLT